MTEGVWRRCAELLIAEFPTSLPPGVRPTIAQVERFTEGRLDVLRELHRKVKRIRETSHFASFPGYRCLGDVQELFDKACLQWTAGPSRAGSEERAHPILYMNHPVSSKPSRPVRVTREVWVRARGDRLAWRRMVSVLRESGPLSFDAVAVKIGITYAEVWSRRSRVRALVAQATAGGVRCRISGLGANAIVELVE